MKNRFLRIIWSLGCMMALFPNLSRAQQLPPCEFKNVPIEAVLMSEVSTSASKPGDTFLLAVNAPEMYKGAKIEARVRNLVAPARGFGKGKPNIEMEFNTFTLNNDSCAITGDLKNTKNIKGVANVDDEGRVIGHTSNKKRIGGALLGSLVGGLAGYAAGGTNGIAGGAAAGAAAGFYLTAKLTAAGSDITFKPESTFYVEITGMRPRAD